MKTPNSETFLAMAECARDSEVALKALAYFFSIYPEDMGKAMGRESYDTIVVTVPFRDDGDYDPRNPKTIHRHWTGGSYKISRKVVNEMLRLRKADKVVESIKLCRQETGMGLKEAKDLSEYIAAFPV